MDYEICLAVLLGHFHFGYFHVYVKSQPSLSAPEFKMATTVSRHFTSKIHRENRSRNRFFSLVVNDSASHYQLNVIANRKTKVSVVEDVPKTCHFVHIHLEMAWRRAQSVHNDW